MVETSETLARYSVQLQFILKSYFHNLLSRFCFVFVFFLFTGECRSPGNFFIYFRSSLIENQHYIFFYRKDNSDLGRGGYSTFTGKTILY
uniref:Uncharacterized protein n=1 Tax=Anguilla anguilla TaxID=7936 RepID=A0A0E9S4D8_ANGAN